MDQSSIILPNSPNTTGRLLVNFQTLQTIDDLARIPINSTWENSIRLRSPVSERSLSFRRMRLHVGRKFQQLGCIKLDLLVYCRRSFFHIVTSLEPRSRTSVGNR